MRIHEYLAKEGITSSRVLAAFEAVPREQFVPEAQRNEAEGDYPLPIGHGQTISQPYIVAYMTETLDIRPGDRVLEVGTGSGYQAAIIANLSREIYSIEVIKPLADRARSVLDELGYTFVLTRVGNGYNGWPENAPYDRIIVTAAATRVPPPLVDQLGRGGKLIIPVGPPRGAQELVLVKKSSAGRVSAENLLPVRFVPFTCEGEGPESR